MLVGGEEKYHNTETVCFYFICGDDCERINSMYLCWGPEILSLGLN